MEVMLERRAWYEVEALLMMTRYEEASIERRVSWYSMRAFLEKMSTR